MPSSLPQKTAHLLSLYESLSPAEQSILQLISVVYEPTTSEVIHACSVKLLEEQFENPEMQTTGIFACLRKLRERSLINWCYQCNPLIVEIISRKSVESKTFAKIADIIQKILPLQGDSYKSLQQKSTRHLREMRIGLYSRNFDYFNSHLFKYNDCPEASEQHSPLVDIFNNPFEETWFKTLPAHLQLHGLQEICRKSHLNLESLDRAQEYIEGESIFEIIPSAGWPSLYYLLIAHNLAQGNFKTAQAIVIKAGEHINTFGLRGCLYFLQGKTEESIHEFKSDLKELRSRQEKKNAVFVGPEGLFYLLALLKTGDYRKHPTILSYISAVQTTQGSNPLLPAYEILFKITRAQLENFRQDFTIPLWYQGPKDAFSALLAGLGCFWLNGKFNREQQEELHLLFLKAKENGYLWIAAEYASLLREATGETNYQYFQDDFLKKSGVVSLLSVFPHEKTWQRALKALNLVSQERETDGITRYRMSWLIDYKDGFVTITPREQKMTAKGQWSQGRSVSLKRLHEGQNLHFLSGHDQKIQATLSKRQTSQGDFFEFDMDETLPALVGHPYLFLAESPAVSVEFTKGEPELQAIETEKKINLRFSPPLGNEKTLAIRETFTRFKIIEISPKHRKISSIIGDDGLTLPAESKKEILQTLGNLSSCLIVLSDIGDSSAEIEEKTASEKIIIQLLPVGSGFRIAMLVRPFGSNGPYLYPGQGSAHVIAEIDGQRQQTKRDLQAEKGNCTFIEKNCPTLSRHDGTDGEWFIDDLQDCLEVLDEIQNLGNKVTVEWPEGEKLSIRHHASFENFHLHIKGRHNWFELDGQLSIDQEKILEMQELLELSQANSGRFIQLAKGQFLALSREFRKKLDELCNFAEQHGKNTRIHPLASCALENFTNNGIQVTADKTWHDQIERIRKAQELHPQVPPTLQAELRHYQREGFKWLARLCHWGVGACLADDMGLGKTIQAVSIMLYNAPGGPSLVVAPTSVCLNWQEEIKRFAPTLRSHLFGPKDRTTLLKNLTSFDVLICSYGLLQQEGELLTSRRWQTIVLDEAQAIKNISTKRSRAAMGLEGDFKLITTGTPIENHLGELWNLFNFINPGLLGSFDNFNQKFGTPIEKDNDFRSRRRLKKLIQPFILRRLKNQVLEELPPRTEVTLHVDMSEEERLFYEALRQRALAKINKTSSQPGQKHIQILAEIMRLRQACCNPRLVQSDCTIHSSKLELFGTTIQDLLENRHKALVFSQFTGHLKILRSYLDQKKIQYQYLDGSTPLRKRQESVTAFQAGSGDVFLISLKAGGLGLNLTAADYVIHMDPWWNPAVEDQASDRAHRIGQTRPVTVYRFVTRNSIEEKILTLHHKKRQLADKLLEGTDKSHTIDADELLKLLLD